MKGDERGVSAPLKLSKTFFLSNVFSPYFCLIHQKMGSLLCFIIFPDVALLMPLKSLR